MSDESRNNTDLESADCITFRVIDRLPHFIKKKIYIKTEYDCWSLSNRYILKAVLSQTNSDKLKIRKK